MQMDRELRQALREDWEIDENSTVDQIRVALADAKMENTIKHTLISYHGKMMIDGEELSAEALYESL